MTTRQIIEAFAVVAALAALLFFVVVDHQPAAESVTITADHSGIATASARSVVR